MKYTFVRNINNMGEDGIVDIENETLICLCQEEQSKIIIPALSDDNINKVELLLGALLYAASNVNQEVKNKRLQAEIEKAKQYFLIKNT